MKRFYYKSIFGGFYAVCAENGFKDGFLNQCRHYRLPMWNIKTLPSGKLYFCVPCEFLESIRECAALSGMEIDITGVFGVMPFARKHKDRVFLLGGVIFTVLFLGLMSTRVWNIRVSGNETVFSSEILSACKELGLKEGVQKSKIDVEDFQYALLEKMSDSLIWVSLNIEGMCAEIEVRELKKVHDDIIGKPCNYIADFDGVIKMCRVYSGTPAVTRGSGVHKGDMLISGVIEYETGESSFTEARGKLTAQHTVKINEKPQSNIKIRSYTHTSKRYSLSMFGFELRPFLKKSKNTEATVKSSLLEINGLILPFGINKYSFTHFEEEETSDEKLLELTALSRYLEKVRESFKNSRVVSAKEKREKGFKGKFEVIDNIGEKSVIMLENE